MGVARIKMVFKTIKLDKITSEVHVEGEDSLEAPPYFRVDISKCFPVVCGVQCKAEMQILCSKRIKNFKMVTTEL